VAIVCHLYIICIPNQKTEILLNSFYLNGVCISVSSVDETAGDDNIVTFLKLHQILCDLETVIEHNISRIEFFVEDRDDTPAQAESSPDVL